MECARCGTNAGEFRADKLHRITAHGRAIGKTLEPSILNDLAAVWAIGAQGPVFHVPAVSFLGAGFKCA